MQQIADWLQKLGLGQYAQGFAENDISFSVLPDLTDQDLKEIGVSLGHRRQLLRAIAELRDGDENMRCRRRATYDAGAELRPYAHSRCRRLCFASACQRLKASGWCGIKLGPV
jgi:SAM domain (Sterile alpha motif)